MTTLELIGGVLIILMSVAMVVSIIKDISIMAENWKIGTNVQIGASARYTELMPDDMPPVKTHRIQLHRHRGVSIEEITLERP